ncbi:MAG: hypothetical protein IT357_10560 [Gemmatimonadaceae bacterium]|nr:hypothetical protein [Gemmatimonadaceae bacterium]
MLESVPLHDPAQRASVRQATLEYRDFVQRAPESAPTAVREIIDRLLERTA